MTLNRCDIIGNLGRDAELRYTASATPLVEFSVAVNAPKRGDKEPDTEWFSCVWWGFKDSDKPSTCEKVAPFLVKGKQVYVTGRMKTRNWEDDEGVKHWKTDLVVQNVELLGSREESGGQSQSRKAPDSENPYEGTGDIDVDDLPFE